MSYINLHKVSAMEESGERDQILIQPLHEGNEVASYRDGEELMAAVKLLRMLDGLDNGEALVITVNIF